MNNKNQPKLIRKSVAITGVTQGLGEAMVHEFVRLGWMVFGCARREDKLSELANKYTHCEFTPVDVSQYVNVKNWVDFLSKKYGIPQIVINNAAIIDNPRQPFTNADINQIKNIIDINLIGTMNVCHAFLPYLQLHPNQTILINMSSSSGKEADVGLAGYCASKFGVEGFTMTIAQENKGSVTVVTLDPCDGVATPMLEQCTDKEYYLSRPTAEEWASIAVPYILNISPELSVQQLIVPEIKKDSRH